MTKLGDVVRQYISGVHVPENRPILVPATDVEEGFAFIPSQWADHDCYIIEYVDAAGAPSVRRVAVARHTETHVQCHCFERNAYRSFRRDRIRAVFDIDGELLDPAPFQIGVVETVATAQSVPAHHQFRRFAQPEVMILRAIALCDGRAGRRENALIEAFAFRLMNEKGLADTADNRRDCGKWVRGFYPYEGMIDPTLTELVENRSTDEIIQLLRLCRDLIKADGKVEPVEFERFQALGNAISLLLKQKSAQPNA